MNFSDVVSQTQNKLSNAYEQQLLKLLLKTGYKPKESALESTGLYFGLFAAGLAAGVAVSVLFAPESGTELRRTVKRKIAGDYDFEDLNQVALPRYDFESDRFRNIRRPRRSHRFDA